MPGMTDYLVQMLAAAKQAALRRRVIQHGPGVRNIEPVNGKYGGAELRAIRAEEGRRPPEASTSAV